MDLQSDLTNATRALVLRHWQFANERDWQNFSQLLAPDLVYEFPQTRERVSGRAGYTDFFATWPGTWNVKIVKCIADSAHALTLIEFMSDEPPMTGLTVFEARAGLIARVTDYWPSPYEPAPRASIHVQRY